MIKAEWKNSGVTIDKPSLDFILYNYLFQEKHKDKKVAIKSVQDELMDRYDTKITFDQVRKSCYQYVSAGLLIDNYDSYSVAFVNGIVM